MAQKLVLKVMTMTDEKTKKKAVEAAADIYETRQRNREMVPKSTDTSAHMMKGLFGVEEIEIDMETQKITVRGYAIEEKKVLKSIKRTGKAAKPWPYPYPGGYSHFTSFYKYPSHIVNHYYYDTFKNVSLANIQSFFHTPVVYSVAIALDEVVALLFRDKNPHACTTM